MITQSYEALISLLTQESSIYEEMHALLEEESGAVAAMAVERMGEIATRKETLALRIKALDESRKVLARRLAEALGLAADEVTISRLCEKAPSSIGMRLSVVGQALRETVEKCISVNQSNERAIRRGRDLINGTIEYMIEQSDPAGRLYQAPRAAKGYAAASRAGSPGFISRSI